jgi:predicted site-specific integrase-resolvase
MKAIKLSHWAKQNGYTYRGAYDMYLRGQLPDAFRMASGSIFVNQSAATNQSKTEYTAIYARVSTPKQKDDLTRQVEYIEMFCVANGWHIDKVYKDIGSGLNDNRQQLNQLLSNDKMTRVVISDKDRLTRFGFNYIKKLLENKNCNIVVINNASTDTDDLMQDFVSVITSMAARVYGLRRHKRHVEEILEKLNG